jgi:hypothetical protein
MRTKLLNPIGVRLDDELKNRAEYFAEIHRLSLADLIRAALREQIVVWDKAGVISFRRTPCETTRTRHARGRA